MDLALGHPEPFDLVEIAAGRGELISALIACVPADLARRLRPRVIELAPRPADLPAQIVWSAQLPTHITGVLLAVEWLDNVPVDVATTDIDPAEPDLGAADTPGYVLVDRAGAERRGPRLSPADQAWLDRWWPLPDSGIRAELGTPRDAAWADAVLRLDAGLALAVDYAHHRATRPPLGTLTGYRDGQQVAPVPDGSCDLTAHVAMDSVAAAGALVAGVPPTLVCQRDALHNLGVDGTRPPLALASTDPVGYLRRLAAAGAAAELTDRTGLGGHTWLLQPVAIAWPVRQPGVAPDIRAGRPSNQRGETDHTQPG